MNILGLISQLIGIKTLRLTREIRSHEQEPPKCFFHVEGLFSDRDSGQTGENLGDPELHVMSECVLFFKVPDLRIKL